MELVSEYFSDPPKALQYLENIRDQNPRYVRDQVKMIHTVCDKYKMQQRDTAMLYCMENKIFLASDFEPVLVALDQEKLSTGQMHKVNRIEKEKYRILPQKSNLSDYNQILN